MKKKLFLSLLILVVVCCFGTSYTSAPTYTPILMKRTDLVNSVRYISEGRALVNPGKIYYKKPYLFINERYKGIHVIDNTLPESPKNIGYIVAPGCLDMAVKDHFLYLDNSIDLVTFDLDTRQVIHRVENVFPEPAHPTNMWYTVKNQPEGMVVVGWQLVNP